MKHFILYDQIADQTVERLIEIIRKGEKKQLKEIKLVDLIYQKKSMTGVYLFFDQNDVPVYVGKTGSRAILERIAGHFDFRQNVFMNSFICALASKPKKRGADIATAEDLQSVYEAAFEHKFLFIEIPNWGEERKIINRLESILSHSLESKLNSRRGIRNYSLQTLVRDLR